MSDVEVQFVLIVMYCSSTYQELYLGCFEFDVTYRPTVIPTEALKLLSLLFK